MAPRLTSNITVNGPGSGGGAAATLIIGGGAAVPSNLISLEQNGGILSVSQFIDLRENGRLVLGGDQLLSPTELRVSSDPNATNGAEFAIGDFNQTLTQVHLFSGTISGSAGILVATDRDYDLQSGDVSARLGGTVGLTKSTTGMVTLTGDNPYTGPTSINDGTLALVRSGNIAQSSRVTANGVFDISGTTAGTSIRSLAGSGEVNLGDRTLTLTEAGDTFDGVIRGTGNLDLCCGSQTLTGVNTYTGLTMVHAGAALTLAGSGSVAGELINQGTVNITGAGPHVMAGDIINEASFRVTNTSVQYNGDFTNLGAYISDPSTSQFANLTVGPSGYLVGGAGDTFIVTGDFYNASTQNSAWNTSQSSLVFATGAQGNASHLMQLAGIDYGATAQGAVNNFAWGSVTLNNGNRLSLADGNQTPGAALYTGRVVLPGGRAGLASISSDYNVYFDPTLPENDYLQGGGAFGSGAGRLLPWSFVPYPADIGQDQNLTPNQQNFGAAVNEACGAPRGASPALLGRCAQLQGLSPSQQQASIVSLTPDQVPGQSAVPIKFTATRMQGLSSRLASLRAGGGSPLSFNFNGVELPLNKTAGMLGTNARGGSAGEDSGFFGSERLGAFVQARFNFGDLSSNPWTRSFNSQSRAVTIGADYRFTEELVAGLAFNYTNTYAFYDQSAGSANTDAFIGALYGSYYLPKDFFIDWYANYGGNDYTFDRQFAYPGFTGQTTSKPSGSQYSFAVSGGKDFHWQEWLMTPFVRLEYVNLQIGSYQELGGSGFAMTTGHQNYDSFVTDLGAQVSHAVSLPWGVLTPALRVEWEHQYLNDNQAIHMRLADAAPGFGSFAIYNGNPDRDYVNLGGSVSATLPNGGAGFVRYESRLGQSYISEHIVEAGVRMSF